MVPTGARASGRAHKRTRARCQAPRSQHHGSQAKQPMEATRSRCATGTRPRECPRSAEATQACRRGVVATVRGSSLTLYGIALRQAQHIPEPSPDRSRSCVVQTDCLFHALVQLADRKGRRSLARMPRLANVVLSTPRHGGLLRNCHPRHLNLSCTACLGKDDGAHGRYKARFAPSAGLYTRCLSACDAESCGVREGGRPRAPTH